MRLPRVPRRTTPAFGFSYVERSLKDCLRHRYFRKEDQQKAVEFFAQWEPQPAGVYCGSRNVRRWDHVVAVMKDGATLLGNMVLACSTCDDSKAQKDYDEWMVGSGPKSPTSIGIVDVPGRVERIKQYVDHFGYQLERTDDLLDKSELQRLVAIRAQLKQVREEVQSLISDFRERTGYK